MPVDQLLNFTPWVLQGGAVGLLFWVARLVFIGSLVPRATLEASERRGDQWRDAYFAEAARSREIAAQQSTILTAVAREVSK